MERVCCRAPGMFFPYTNSVLKQRGQSPTSSASRPERWVCLLWLAFSLPRSQPLLRPLPSPPFALNLGGVCPPHPCSFPRAGHAVGPRPPRPGPAAIRNWRAFIFLALNFNQMQIPNTLQTQRPVQMLIAGAGDAVRHPGKRQDGTAVPTVGDGAVWPCARSWLCPKSRSHQVPSLHLREDFGTHASSQGAERFSGALELGLCSPC